MLFESDCFSLEDEKTLCYYEKCHDFIVFSYSEYAKNDNEIAICCYKDSIVITMTGIFLYDFFDNYKKFLCKIRRDDIREIVEKACTMYVPIHDFYKSIAVKYEGL